MKSIFEFLGLSSSKQKGNVGGTTKTDKNVNKPEEKTESRETKQKQQTERMEKEKSNKAHIYNLMIVDESGSMSHLRESTLSGINETIQTIRSSQEKYSETQEHRLTLVTFDSGSNRPNVRTMIDNVPILQVYQFGQYQPNGCTPLYDAMGQSLTQLHQQIKDDEDATAVVTVLTDGLENSSVEWKASDLRMLIEKLKEEGWSFSYMGSAHNVKEVTDLLSIDNVIEFSHDDLGAGNTWRRESSSKMAYYDKMDKLYCREKIMSSAERRARRRQFAQEYYSPRVTPDHIDELKENEIFVFSSHSSGVHDSGAALQAVLCFGAIQGQGEGLQGKSYAIPTSAGIIATEEAVDRFVAYAKNHPEMHFLVTRLELETLGLPTFHDSTPAQGLHYP